MSCKFFGDLESFRTQLKSKVVAGRCCWSCSKRGGLLIDFNVNKDFATFGIFAEVYKSRLPLCPPCAVEYMNSFDVSHHVLQGGKGTPELWTVEELLASWMESHGS